MELEHEFVRSIHGDLENAKNILVVTHVRPDGDAIGSVLGIGLALLETGKNVQMVISDGIPANYNFLSGCELISTTVKSEVDYIIVVDSADIERTDPIVKKFPRLDLNIDHHQTNTRFANKNLIDTNAVATAEVIAGCLPEWGLVCTRSVANALLTGIVTDTIGFRTSNMHPDALRISADLMELGGNLVDIYYKTIIQQSFSAAKYWGAGLSKLQMDDGLVWTTLSLTDRAEAGYQYRDDADLVKILSSIDGAIIAVILTEQSGGYVKISWRLCGSKSSDLSVSDIALKFGGGGHKAAAGADVKGKLEDVLEEVLASTRQSLNGIGKPLQ